MASFAKKYKEIEGEHRSAGPKEIEKTGKAFKEASLEKAERREWAQKRFGDERRFGE